MMPNTARDQMRAQLCVKGSGQNAGTVLGLRTFLLFFYELERLVPEQRQLRLQPLFPFAAVSEGLVGDANRFQQHAPEHSVVFLKHIDANVQPHHLLIPCVGHLATSRNWAL